MKRSRQNLQGPFSVECDGTEFLEARRVSLLEAIDRFGSITQAARALPMSYKGAWDALGVMTRIAGRPVVSCTTGGRGGGSCHLTEYGRTLVAFFRAIEGEYQTAVLALARHVETPKGERDFKSVLMAQSLPISIACRRSTKRVRDRISDPPPGSVLHE